MGLLKKLGKRKGTPVTVGKLLNPFLLIDKMKEQRLLQTTDTGVFYTYPEVLAINKDPKNMLKQLYVYGRSTGLLKKGEVLQIRDTEEGNLLATILGDEVSIHKLKNKDKAEN